MVLGACILFRKRRKTGELNSAASPVPSQITEEKEIAGTAVSANRFPEGRREELESGVNLPELQESRERNGDGGWEVNGILHEVP